MDLNEYQTLARGTAVYPNIGDNFSYPTLGLCGEAGEVAEKCKKIIRDQDGNWNIENRNAIIKELGDVLWYLSQVAAEFNVELNEVADKNLAKLYDRKERGKLQGSGDDR